MSRKSVNSEGVGIDLLDTGTQSGNTFDEYARHRRYPSPRCANSRDPCIHGVDSSAPLVQEHGNLPTNRISEGQPPLVQFPFPDKFFVKLVNPRLIGVAVVDHDPYTEFPILSRRQGQRFFR